MAAQTKHAPATSAAAPAKFPPKDLAGFVAFAATGDASKIHQYATDTRGAADCPTPNMYATAADGLSVRQLQADEAAFFVQHGLHNARCQAGLFLYHSSKENQNGGFTVGRVFLDQNPDGSHNIEVDAGDVVSAERFDFNF